MCFKCLGRGLISSQCPTKRIMILRGIDVYSSQDEESDIKGEEKNTHKGEDAFPCIGDHLMIKRTFHKQPSSQALTQKENIFHTRCKVLENTCSLIVNSGLCCNCCSTRLVEKLALGWLKHQ